MLASFEEVASRLRQSKYLVRQSKYLVAGRVSVVDVGDDLVVLVLLTWVTTWMTLALARRRSIVGVDRDVIEVLAVNRSLQPGVGDTVAVSNTGAGIVESFNPNPWSCWL